MWPFGNHSEKRRVIVCGLDSESIGKIANFLQSKYEVLLAHGLQDLQRFSGVAADVAILLQLSRADVSGRKHSDEIAYTKKMFPDIKVIYCHIQHLGQVCLNAGADVFHSTEIMYYGQGSGHYLFPLAAADHGPKLLSLDKNLLGDQIELLCKQSVQSVSSLEEEKREFYDAVSDIFLVRSTQTADITQELIFLEQELKKIRAHNVLDAGCGLGRLSLPLARKNFNVTGVDLSHELLERAQQEANKNNIPVRFMQQNLLSLALPQESYDAALLMWHTVCDLKDHRLELFRNVARVIRPGGCLIFDFPDITKNKHITREGVYTNNTPFGQYVSLVPQIQSVFQELISNGMSDIVYYRVRWGIPKFVVVARKYGLT